MLKQELLTLSSVAGLFSLPGAYAVAASFLFGATVWVSFFGGVIAYKTLPRQQFGNLQHKTFPIYFLTSIVLSGSLLAGWIKSHPNVLQNLGQPRDLDVAQVWALGFVLLAQGANYLVVGPMTSKVMFQRHKLEKNEGKTYDQKDVSSEMKALNRSFGSLHGVSSLFNLGAVFASLFHVLVLGNTNSRIAGY